MKHRSFHFLLGAILMTPFAMIACSDDTGPASPEVSETGTIVVDPQPDLLNAPWRLEGPENYSKTETGDQTLTDLRKGVYDLWWDEARDWTQPDPSQVTFELSAGETKTLVGVYAPIQVPGSAEALVERQTISGRLLDDEDWYVLELDHAYDEVFIQFSDVAEGPTSQAIWYLEVLGGTLTEVTRDTIQLASPDPSVRASHLVTPIPGERYYLKLSGGSTGYLFTAYFQATGTIVVDPDPDALNARWRMWGPDTFSIVANGDQTLTDLQVGSFTLRWDKTGEWTQPDPSEITFELLPNETKTITGVYKPLQGPDSATSLAEGQVYQGSLEWGQDDWFVFETDQVYAQVVTQFTEIGGGGVLIAVWYLKEPDGSLTELRNSTINQDSSNASERAQYLNNPAPGARYYLKLRGGVPAYEFTVEFKP